MVVTLENLSMMFHPVSLTNFMNGSIRASLEEPGPWLERAAAVTAPRCGVGPVSRRPIFDGLDGCFSAKPSRSSLDGSIRYTFDSPVDLSTSTSRFTHRRTSSPPQNISPSSPNGSKFSLALFFFCRIVLSHSPSWKNSAGKLSPARELMMTEPYHHPTLGGRTRREKTALKGMAKA